ncbi:DUF1565 domain-containing protein [Waterburya agarophytonicola K14]|uniref:DUF1565 domain-containing protein n=2 Tax=Waterburya TaxID=2886915 RepID=A0A964BQE1_9CYAN|nr:DUF1565 domain-containing protein [Waterburya agarophytonicola KI4]
MDNKFYFSLMKFPNKVKYIAWLPIALTIIVTYDLGLKTEPALTQNAIESSFSLDKNIIYVNSKSGDDSQVGEKLSPLKTITQALKIAAPGTKIQLAPGTYNEDSGEEFPLVVRNKITLQGNAKNQGHNIIIKGGGSFVSPTAAGQNVAIAALQDAGQIIGISITNDHSRGHGLWIESSNPNIISNTFTRNGNTGVSVNGKSAPLIENNYFYNNSGNGLLVYGTSQPQVKENTFEQTGFGVSLVQNSIATLTSNYFDGNRIGLILEGNSQAILRNNEIVNSSESGLTAIAQSRVDLGTNEKEGNNVFRSNKKLDIQNATNHEIVAVGTETNNKTEGNINFDRGEFSPRINIAKDTRPLLAPLDSNNNSPAPLNLPPTTTTASSLPSPPPVPEQKTSNKELIFTPASSSISSTPEPEPVPFLPQISNSALTSNNSQISSLSDVLGSRNAVSVKYKVLVEAEDESDELDVRSLFPEAFATIYQGKSVLQIGAFNNWDKAKQAKQSLEDLGLNTHILE